MVNSPGAGAQVRARIAQLKQRLQLQGREEEAEATARQLDADEVGLRADRRRAERQSTAARPGDPAPRD